MTESKKFSRQSSEEDLLDSESLSVSREDLLEEVAVSPRRRRKGLVEGPKKSMYDTGYFEEEESVREVSTRARRTRKGTSDPCKPLERQTGTSRQSLDDLSRKEKGDTLKRRGTNKKMDAEKAKSAAARETKEKKNSDSRRQAGAEAEDSDQREADSGDEKGQEELDEKNVVFCMWGHENCKTRSHYRYNWQWDYVTKYAEQHNKHLVQVSQSVMKACMEMYEFKSQVSFFFNCPPVSKDLFDMSVFRDSCPVERSLSRLSVSGRWRWRRRRRSWPRRRRRRHRTRRTGSLARRGSGPG